MSDSPTRPNDVDETAVPRVSLRPAEAAEATGLGKRKIDELIADRSSGFPHFRVGRAVLIPLHELAVWMSDQVKGQKR